MSLAALAEFFLPTRIVFGEGSLGRLGDETRSLGAERVVISTDKGIAASGIVDQALAVLQSAGVAATVLDEVEPEPSVGTVGRLRDLFRSERAGALVAVGGGSSIDAAKAAAIWATNGGELPDYAGAEKFTIAPVPVVAIPTTAGTGAEVSYAAAITDLERHVKFTIRHLRFNRARVAILDPSLLRSVPAVVAVDAGMDALAHAVESYTALKADFFSEALSLHAMELIGANVRPFVANRGNAAAGAAMLAASAMASIAFSTAGTGNGHCLARFVGPALGLTHGRTNAILLPHVVAFNAAAAPAKYARVAQALGEPVAGLPEREAAQRAALAVGALCRDLGLPGGFKTYHPDTASIAALARAAADAGYNQWNPRLTTYEEFRALLEHLFSA